jgi:hypothetical protein
MRALCPQGEAPCPCFAFECRSRDRPLSCLGWGDVTEWGGDTFAPRARHRGTTSTGPLPPLPEGAHWRFPCVWVRSAPVVSNTRSGRLPAP